MVGIKHHTQTAKANDPTKDVSANAWNEAHDAGAIADVLTDHTQAVHNALNINADTLDTKHASDFALVAQAVPSGSIMAYGGAAAPSGYLLCDGTSYLRADYTDLFTAISTAYGSADGTHFNVPDLRSKFPLGKGGALALGDTGGATTYTHAGVAIQDHATNAHTHTYTAAGTIAGSSGSGGTHTHDSHTGSTKTLGSAAGVPFTGPTTHSSTGTAHTHDQGTYAFTGTPNQNTGNASAALAHSVTSSGNDHTNVQPPYQVVNYIIKT